MGLLRDADVRVGGALQYPVLRDGERIGYDVAHVQDGRRVPLARPSDQPVLCDWGFDEAAFAAARQWCLAPELDVVVLEAGSLESAKQGHWPTIEAVLRAPRRVLLLALRPRTMAPIVLRLPDPAADMDLTQGPADAPALARSVLSVLRGTTP